MADLESAALLSTQRGFSIYRTTTKAVGIIVTLYVLILAIICIGVGLIVFPIFLVIFAILFGVLSLHFLSRVIVNFEGIRKEYLLGYGPPCLPWNSVTVTADSKGVYTVQGNGSMLTFRTDIPRFDELLNSIRSHGVHINCNHEPPVDRNPSRSQPFPEKIPNKFFNFYQTPAALQAVIFVSAIVVAIAFPQMFSVSVWVPLVILYCVFGGLAIFALFSYISLQHHGLDIASNFFMKKFYPWSEIGYIRFVRAQKGSSGGIWTLSTVTVTLLRVHSKSGTLLTEMQYSSLAHHEDIVNAAVVQGIPILAEAEPYGPQSNAMELKAPKLQYS